MPGENSPDPEEVQDQMWSAIERIRAKLTEPEANQQTDDLAAANQADTDT